MASLSNRAEVRKPLRLRHVARLLRRREKGGASEDALNP